MSEPLSPAAQAVVDAWDAKLNPDPDGLTYLTHDPEREALAAALRAVADVALPRNARGMANRQELRAYILAIAAELEAQP